MAWFIAPRKLGASGTYLAAGRAFKGQLAVLRGNAKNGIEWLRDSLADLHAMRYELLTTPFNISLVQGLAATGQFSDAMTLIDNSIRLVEANGDHCYMPELLRVKATVSCPCRVRDSKEVEQTPDPVHLNPSHRLGEHGPSYGRRSTSRGCWHRVARLLMREYHSAGRYSHQFVPRVKRRTDLPGPPNDCWRSSDSYGRGLGLRTRAAGRRLFGSWSLTTM